MDTQTSFKNPDEVMKAHTIHWISVKTFCGDWILMATNLGVCWLAGPGTTAQDGLNWMNRWYKGSSLKNETTKILEHASLQLEDYFGGKNVHFSVPLDVHGTDFQMKVWNALKALHYGQTTSYKAIAQSINNPQAVRAVGAAIGSNPISIIIPCHRVIGSDGTLTGYAGGLPLKAQLLKLEKI